MPLYEVYRLLRSWAHNPKVVGSNPTPATNVMSRDIGKARTPFQGSGFLFFRGP